MTAPDPAETLAARARGGDRDAFAELVERCRSRFVALVSSRLHSRSVDAVEADEVVQEACLRAVQSIDRFEWQGEDSFLRWLGGIAEHVIVDAIRKSDRQAMPLEVDVAGDDTSPSRSMRRDERFDRMQRALDQLDPDHKKVIILARLKKLRIQEIAQQMDRTPNAVSHLLMRATQRLRELLEHTESLHLPDRRLDTRGDEK